MARCSALALAALALAVASAAPPRAAWAADGAPAKLGVSKVEQRLSRFMGLRQAQGARGGANATRGGSEGGSAPEEEPPGGNATHAKALPPLLLFMGDCSGSTWVQSLARAMLIAHDVPFLEKRYEDIKEVRTEVLGNKGPAWKTFRNRLRKAERMGAHYVSKFNTDDLRSRVSGAITDLARGARVVSVWRSQALEKLVCLIHDCFLENGNFFMVEKEKRGVFRCSSITRRPNQTFQDFFVARRAYVREEGVKVYLRPTAALATVNNELLGLGDEQAEMLRGAGVQDFATLTTEALEAFEFSSDGLEVSVDAWCTFLRSWGVEAREETVRYTLVNGGYPSRAAVDHHGGSDAYQLFGGGVGERKRKPLGSVIFNYNQIARAFSAPDQPATVKALLDDDGRAKS